MISLKCGLECLLFANCFCGPAIAQYQRGTVVALVTSPQGTFVAADSRNHPTSGEIRDDMCKILTFGEKIAVAVGGIGNHVSSRPAESWDAWKQLRLAYAKQAGSTHAFAAEWGSEMRALILRDVSDDPAPLIGAIDSWDGSEGEVVSAIFVGRDHLEGFAVKLTLLKLRKGYDVRPNELRHPPADCDFVCGGIGTDVIDEIRAGKTTRAIVWHDAMSHLSASDRAIEAVRLTIKNSPRQKDVGGAIDAVLVSNSGVHWIQRKRNCEDHSHRSDRGEVDLLGSAHFLTLMPHVSQLNLPF